MKHFYTQSKNDKWRSAFDLINKSLAKFYEWWKRLEKIEKQTNFYQIDINAIFCFCSI